VGDTLQGDRVSGPVDAADCAQSPCRIRIRSSWPRIGRAEGFLAKGSAVKASTLLKSARRSRPGSAARSLAATAETINFKLALSPRATAQSTRFIANGDIMSVSEPAHRSRSVVTLRTALPLILARADEVIE
jgi:hypothetical protein